MALVEWTEVQHVSGELVDLDTTTLGFVATALSNASQTVDAGVLRDRADVVNCINNGSVDLNASMTVLTTNLRTVVEDLVARDKSVRAGVAGTGGQVKAAVDEMTALDAELAALMSGADS